MYALNHALFWAEWLQETLSFEVSASSRWQTPLKDTGNASAGEDTEVRETDFVLVLNHKHTNLPFYRVSAEQRLESKSFELPLCSVSRTKTVRGNK